MSVSYRGIRAVLRAAVLASSPGGGLKIGVPSPSVAEQVGEEQHHAREERDHQGGRQVGQRSTVPTPLSELPAPRPRACSRSRCSR